MLQDWAGQSMLNKSTENILKLNLGAFNLRLPWQIEPASPTHLTRTWVVIRDATGQHCFKALTAEWRACQSVDKSVQKRERERKSRLIFSEPSQPAASWKPLCRVSHRHNHRLKMPVTTSQCPLLVGKGWDSLALCVSICCFYFKSPGKLFCYLCSSESAEGW